MVGSLELVVALLTGAILIGQNLARLEITAMVLIMLALFIKQVDVKTHHKALVYN
ncbi:hypothetical protein REIFOR_01294 [Reinekea forsetii]|uniref:Uncharacterized protein n=1 Tax=Reinekea forsetii TaxID=1336806 RepID=A0A2K8KNR1_9GAMM|nr:hypothetical protein REIFOR_01294 [Reinekea forsetii]